MNKTLIRSGLALAFAATAAFGLTACGSDDANNPSSSASESQDGAAGADTGESAEFVADITEGVEIIKGQLDQTPEITQIMLASDVDQPTQKYGMWIMPYYPSEATAKFISTVQIEGGKFKVTSTSAATSKVWEMDQDGNLTEVTK